jgi:hypothetical protein
MFIIGIFTFINFNEIVGINLWFTNLYLPVAIWVLIPMFLIFILSLLHMSVYSFKFIINEKNISKDHKKLTSLIKNLIIDEQYNGKFNNKIFNHITQLLNNSKLVVDKEFVSEFEPFQETITKIRKINGSEYVDLREYSIQEHNNYRQKNMRNKSAIDSKYALKVIKNKNKYSEPTRTFAISSIIDFGLLKEAKQHICSVKLDVDLAHKFFLNTSKNNTVELTKDEILNICKNYNFTENDYIKLAEDIKIKYEDVDEYLQLFEDIANEIKEAFSGYVYALINLEMLDKAIEVLSGVSYENYKNLNIYLQMRKAKIKYPIKYFLNSN